MPDRDQFRSLPKGWRRGARTLLGIARGRSTEIDREALEAGFASELASGVRTLAPTLSIFQRFNTQPPLGPELALDELARATRGAQRDRNESLLQEQAERMLMTRQHDPMRLTKSFLERLLRHNVIESKNGVAQALRAEGRRVDVNRLLSAAAPTIEAIAQQIHGRPNFKRLQPTLPIHRPIDLHANILDGLK